MKTQQLLIWSAALLLLPMLPTSTAASAAASPESMGTRPSQVRRERADIVSELIAPGQRNSPRIIVHCGASAHYSQENSYDNEDYEQHTSWESLRRHSERSRSTIREILRNRQDGHRSVTIEIQGNCDDVQVNVGALESHRLLLPNRCSDDCPNGFHSPDVDQYLDQYLEWYEEQLSEGNIPWVIRPGSGWHWLLRD